jgi:hypothetical protein
MLRNTSAKGRQGLKKLALLTLCAALVGGCAATSDPAGNAAADPPANSGTKIARKDPPPDVNRCAIVTISTPVLFECNGKVYTDYQLQHLREQAEQVSSKQ